jgi:hypothetical protein
MRGPRCRWEPYSAVSGTPPRFIMKSLEIILTLGWMLGRHAGRAYRP